MGLSLPQGACGIKAAGRAVPTFIHLGKGRAMHPKDRAAMGRGDRLGQRYGLRSIILYLLALGTIAGGLIVYGCSGDDNNNNRVQVSRATLSGANEVPPVNTQATGTVTLNISSDSSQINYQ